MVVMRVHRAMIWYCDSISMPLYLLILRVMWLSVSYILVMENGSSCLIASYGLIFWMLQVSPCMERAVVEQLVDYFMARLAAYPTTLDEDESLVILALNLWLNGDRYNSLFAWFLLIFCLFISWLTVIWTQRSELLLSLLGWKRKCFMHACRRQMIW